MTRPHPPSQRAPSGTRPQVFGVGLLGLGRLGMAVANLLQREGPLIAQRTGIAFKIVRALVRQPRRRRAGLDVPIALTADPQAVLAAPDVHLVLELMGGLEPAYRHVLTALGRGTSVITANAALVATHMSGLRTAADRAGSDLFFEAAAAGGLPLVRHLREGLAGDRVRAFAGILNGTSNYILDEMRAGETYGTALANAHTLNFCGTDSTADISGADAAARLAILVRLAFNARVDPSALPTLGLDGLTPHNHADAAALGCCLKLVAAAQLHVHGGQRRLDAWVEPTCVPLAHPLAQIKAQNRGLVLEAEGTGTSLLLGAGAAEGCRPAAAAVVADLIEAARSLRQGIAGRLQAPPSAASALPLLPAALSQAAYCLRLYAQPAAQLLPQLTQTLADCGIGVASLVQQERGMGPVPVRVLTHTCSRAAMARALRRLGRLRALRGPPQALRLLHPQKLGIT